MVNDLGSNGDIVLLGLERYDRDLSYGSIKYYLRTELNNKLYDIELDSSNVDTVLLDSSLVKHSLLIEANYRDIGLRQFKSAYVDGELTNEVSSIVKSVSECSKFSLNCKYEVQLEIYVPTVDLLKFSSTGFELDMRTDSTSMAFSQVNLLIFSEQVNEQIINSRFYEFFMIWNKK
tara:strand:- start:447 stop:974 length:528 start_codon:yes stop_codon:yes gene_type:complete